MKLASVAPLIAIFPGTLGLALRQNTAHITFVGAGGAQFTQDFPEDGSTVQISKLTGHASWCDTGVHSWC